MFVAASDSCQLSPQVMRFAGLWLYDLRPFHAHWKEQQRQRPDLWCGDSPWECLLKAYRLHSFSLTEELLPLATDFHRHRAHNLSEKKTRELFHVFRRLGIRRVGQIQKLNLTEIQKRFGVAWVQFFKGVLFPLKADWIWQPFRPLQPLEWKHSFEFDCMDAFLILAEVERALNELAALQPFFSVERAQLALTLVENGEETGIEIPFVYGPYLQRDRTWIYKLLEEKLLQLTLTSPASQLRLTLLPAPPPRTVQLTLFKDQAQALALEELVHKLNDLQLPLFQPESQPSYVPEKSWRRVLALKPSSVVAHALHRPLIQIEPEPIAAPEGPIYFTERLQWFDESGQRHQRDYFFNRGPRAWIWIFVDHQRHWFKQGVVE